MEVTVYKPISPLLKRHIEAFYMLTRTRGDKPCTYLSFPGLSTIVCAYTDSLTTVRDHMVKIKHTANRGVASKIVGEFNRPACIQYEGQANEITILFKPLGLNAFLPEPLVNYTNGHFADFNPFPDYAQFLTSVLSTRELPARINKLERYWESRHIGFEHPFLNQVVAELLRKDAPECSVAAMARKYGISRQHLHHEFQTHMLKSPADFKKIVRFRKALHSKTTSEKDKENLTQLSNLANYFDQSHMIRDFKTVTGYTPKRFFAGLSTLGSGQINWFFQK